MVVATTDLSQWISPTLPSKFAAPQEPESDPNAVDSISEFTPGQTAILSDLSTGRFRRHKAQRTRPIAADYWVQTAHNEASDNATYAQQTRRNRRLSL